MRINAVNKATGEVIELEVANLEDLVKAWKIVQHYDKAAKALKEQLKSIVPEFVNDSGQSEEIDNAMFKVSSVQRMTYDKSILRDVLDEDTYDLFMKPDKKAIDDYLKENIDSLGEDATKLRKGMVADGNPYEVIKLEKLSRD